MSPMKIVGLRGAPNETLAALQEALKGIQFPQASATYITDWQDQRAQARYAIYVQDGRRRVLSLDAFGPRFGPQGHAALQTLTRWLVQQGVEQFKEAILPPSEYANLFGLEEAEIQKALAAKANPADPALYLQP